MSEGRVVYVLKCPGCGAPLADTLPTCPYCGKPTSFEALGMHSGLRAEGPGHLVIGEGAAVVMGAEPGRPRDCPFCGAVVQAGQKRCSYCRSKVVIESLSLRKLTVEKGGRLEITGGSLTVGQPVPSVHLLAAIRRDDLKSVQERLDRAEQLDCVLPEDGATLLHCAVRARAVEVARFLVAMGLDVKARDKKGDTSLHLAAAEALEPVVDALLRAGARPGSKNNRGRTAADLAAERGHAELAGRLAAAARERNQDR
jgi:hypothetical protein